MLACNETVTVVRYDGEGYACTVIEGASWYGRLQVAVQDKGLAAANTFTVRIPAASLPEGFIPQTGDRVARGRVEAAGPADLAPYHHFTVKGVGDARRRPGRLSHVVVTGA